MVASMRQPTLETLGLGSVLDIFKNGRMPATADSLVEEVFGPEKEPTMATLTPRQLEAAGQSRLVGQASILRGTHGADRRKSRGDRQRLHDGRLSGAVLAYEAAYGTVECDRSEALESGDGKRKHFGTAVVLGKPEVDTPQRDFVGQLDCLVQWALRTTTAPLAIEGPEAHPWYSSEQNQVEARSA
jgi:hypothetical protein